MNNSIKIKLLLVSVIINFLFAVSIKSSVNKKECRVDDIVEFRITFEGLSEFPDVDLAILEDNFSIINGPSKQTNMQWVNGVISNSKVLSWNISPLKSGEIIIPSITLKYNQKVIKSNIIMLKVSKESKFTSKDVFITAEISKDSVYYGEQITLSYKIYKKNINISIEAFNLPIFKGFWTEEIFRPKTINFKRINKLGVNYEVGTLYKIALFPMPSDKHTIPTLRIKTNIETNVKKRDPFFDPFFSSFRNKSIQKILSTKEKDISIKSYPLPVPEEFSGAVGEFTIKSSTSKDSIQINKAFTYVISIEGVGNMGMFSFPEYKFSNYLNSMNPEEKFSKNVFRDDLSGVLSREYILIPRKKGEVVILKKPFTYFSTLDENFKTIDTESSIIEILKDDNLFRKKLKNKDNEIINEDIRYLNNSPIIKITEIDDEKVIKYLKILYAMSILFLILKLILRSKITNKLSRKNSIKKYSIPSMIKLIDSQPTYFINNFDSLIVQYISEMIKVNKNEISNSNIENYLIGIISNDEISVIKDFLNDCLKLKYGLDKIEFNIEKKQSLKVALNALDDGFQNR